MSGAKDDLVPVFMPPLVMLLTNLERKKGDPLTRDEVLQTRDGGVCVMLPRAKAQLLARSRGYDDLDPEHCWEQWTEVRARRPGDGPPS
jgi:hypothetical protein